MNSLLQDVQAYIAEGQKFSRVKPSRIDDKHYKVVFQFGDKSSQEKTYNCSHTDFVEWWKHTCVYIRDNANAFDPFEPDAE